ncbi:MAG: peptide-methionine (S)-S-oxide reductase MsrA, partial [Sphingomonadales bacterium]
MQEQATLAGGCFWCTEAIFKDVIGVERVESGYTGGTVPDPSYRRVCEGDTGHAEAIRVTFDPDVIRYDDILDIYFATHDPTQLNRQGNDVGTQYRSAIFPHSPEQETAARAAIARAQRDWDGPVVTAIEPLGAWYPAEDYHQDYFERE